MNRRSSIKSAILLGILGVSTLSIYKYRVLNIEVDLKRFYDYQKLIAELAECIIPKSDSPGAKEANVDQYIINVLINCTPIKEQHKFLDGLEYLETYTRDTYDKSFFKCTEKEKLDVLQYFEDRDNYNFSILNKINAKFLGQSFFNKLKRLTIEGYFSSNLGATKCLSYDYVPVNYIACKPLGLNQKSWATR